MTTDRDEVVHTSETEPKRCPKGHNLEQFPECTQDCFTHSDHELLARIDKEIERLTTELKAAEDNKEWLIGKYGVEGYAMHLKQDRTQLSAWKALRAVVAREDVTARPIMDGRTFAQVDSYRDGYNQCLADIKADIAKELG
jgi:hypothetical protein